MALHDLPTFALIAGSLGKPAYSLHSLADDHAVTIRTVRGLPLMDTVWKPVDHLKNGFLTQGEM